MGHSKSQSSIVRSHDRSHDPSNKKNSAAIFALAAIFPLLQNCGENSFVSKSLSATASSSSTSLALLDVAITDPIANTILQNAFLLKGSCSSNVNVDISGDLTSPLSVACDNGKFSASINFSSGDGSKSIKVAQRDSLGNFKADSRTFVKDTTPPQPNILNLLSGAYVKTQINVSGTCESGLAVIIKVGATQMSTPCNLGMFSGSLAIQSIADGNLNLEVIQTDVVGLTTTRVLPVIKDTIAPAVSISSPAASTVISPLVLAGTCETGLPVTISGSGLASSFSTECLNSAFSTNVNLITGQGSRQVIAGQTDRAGNSGNISRTFQLQTSAPAIAISILSPVAYAVANAGVNLSGSCQSGLTINITGTGLQAGSTATCTNGQFSKAITFSTGEGNKTITVTQTDTTSGTSGFDTRTFIKDSVAPTLTIAAPVANAPTKGSVTIIGACENGLPVSIAGTGIASATSTNCSNGTYSMPVMTSSGDGTKQILVTQTDPATNATTKTVNVIRDSVNPVITITGPAAGTSSATGVSVTGACETGLSVTASGADLTSSFNASCSNGAYTIAVLFAGVDGPKVVTVSQTDGAGNKGSTQRSFTQTSAPVVYDGAQLYATNCSVCHGPLATSSKIGRTATQITAQINNTSNPSMNTNAALLALNSSQIQAIAAALGQSTSLPGSKLLQCTAGKTGSATDIRRLSKMEMTNSLRDILGDSIYLQIGDFVERLREDNLQGGVSKFEQDYSEIQLNVISEMSMAIATLSTASATQLNSLLSKYSTCTNYTTVTDACVNTFISRFGLKVLRRAVSSSDQTWFKGIYALGTNNLERFHSLIMALFQMPEFLYHIEIGAAGVGGTNTLFDLTSEELASRLSYTLWGTTPSDTLLTQAANGDLKDSVKLNAIVDIMLADQKASKKLESFVRAWLNLPGTIALSSNANFLDGLNPIGLQAEAETEMFQFLNYIAFNQKKGYESLLTSDVSFAKSQTLASVYQHALAANPDLGTQKMGVGRKGLLLRAPLFIDGGEKTFPFHRGATFRRKILCDTLGAPDPNAFTQGPNIETEDAIRTMSTRERLTLKTSQTSCMSCHSSINPLGFALQEFDSLGRKRTKEKVFDMNGLLIVEHPIDSNVSELNIDVGGPSTAQSAAEFVDVISQSDKGVSCFVRQAYQYYKIQNEDLVEDGCILADMRDAMAGPNGSIVQGLKKSVIHSGFYKRAVK